MSQVHGVQLPGWLLKSCVLPLGSGLAKRFLFLLTPLLTLPSIGRLSKNEITEINPDFWPKPGPGRLPLDSGRGGVDFVCFLCVCSISILGSEFGFRMHIWETCCNVVKYARAMVDLDYNIMPYHAI